MLRGCRRSPVIAPMRTIFGFCPTRMRPSLLPDFDPYSHFPILPFVFLSPRRRMHCRGHFLPAPPDRTSCNNLQSSANDALAPPIPRLPGEPAPPPQQSRPGRAVIADLPPPW